MIMDELDAPLNREATEERDAILDDGARGRGAGEGREVPVVVSTRRSINASVLRFALIP